MKIVYLINSLKNPGGMERVLINKANYFSQKFGYEIFIITTDQNNLENFYKLNEDIKCIDLKINYFEDFQKSFQKRIIPFLKKKKLHKELLEKKLLELKPDFVISLGCEDTYFLPKIKDSSLKIREFHFGKNSRKDFAKSFDRGYLYKVKAYLDTLREEFLVNKYNKTIILTKEDLTLWKNKSNLKVIYNSISNIPESSSSCEEKKIVSVGRLDGQKGYDRLIEAWKIVIEKNDEWILEIYGDGIDKKKLKSKILELNLENSFLLKGSTNKIEEKYRNSSIYVMSSRYEGFGMVLIEAMSHGLPVISFDCLSGPRDIISDNKDGYLVKNGDIEALAEKILDLMENNEKRKEFGKEAKKNVVRFSEDKIMYQWKELFESYF
ncbi:MAG: glycosyltransferase family 4 protein [Fusobacteriaceae bacterium]